MYEKSTGSLLLQIEKLEAQNSSLQRQVIDAMFDRDVALGRAEREQRECDEQAHLVMVFAKRYEDERALADNLADVLSRYGERQDIAHAAGVMDALDAYKAARSGVDGL